MANVDAANGDTEYVLNSAQAPFVLSVGNKADGAGVWVANLDPSAVISVEWSGSHAGTGKVNLSAQVPGWQRFEAAEQWLRNAAVAHQPPEDKLRQQFRAFVEQQARAGGGDPPSKQRQDEMFDQFLRWRAQQPR